MAEHDFTERAVLRMQRLHPGESSDQVHARLIAEVEDRSTATAETFVDDRGPAFRSKGVTHTLTVVANESGGWLVDCDSFLGSSACNLSQGDAELLASMLLAGSDARRTS